MAWFFRQSNKTKTSRLHPPVQRSLHAINPSKMISHNDYASFAQSSRKKNHQKDLSAMTKWLLRRWIPGSMPQKQLERRGQQQKQFNCSIAQDWAIAPKTIPQELFCAINCDKFAQSIVTISSKIFGCAFSVYNWKLPTYN